ncbi:MAG: anaerobic ribonucleoside-triphosphate reductase activating protein [Clostridia bacterium]|nr:anaerobic ribonucleoside-triphosphate reductase activating protein [Clostridia bacterium]
MRWSDILRCDIGSIEIAGWQKLSLIDYPGKMSAVVFLAGCNMRCHYCHNQQLWSKKNNQIPFMTILEELSKRVGWLDAVVVSGGEPTMFPCLISLLKSLRSLGFLIKLDTNGTNPDVVKKIIALKLVDYIALDVKAPIRKYLSITGLTMQKTLETAKFLKEQKQVKYMFRTTISPRLDIDDLIELGKSVVDGAMCWQIQQCRIVGAYSAGEIQKMAVKLRKYAQNIVVVGV